MLEAAKFEMSLYDTAEGDPVRQSRILKREYAFELLDLDDSDEQRHRLEALVFMMGKRGQESLSPKTPVTPSTKFQAWNTPALDKEENTTFSEISKKASLRL